MEGQKHFEEATNNGMTVIIKMTSTQACLAQTLVTQEQLIFTHRNTCASKCSYSSACRK